MCLLENYFFQLFEALFREENCLNCCLQHIAIELRGCDSFEDATIENFAFFSSISPLLQRDPLNSRVFVQGANQFIELTVDFVSLTVLLSNSN